MSDSEAPQDQPEPETVGDAPLDVPVPAQAPVPAPAPAPAPADPATTTSQARGLPAATASEEPDDASRTDALARMKQIVRGRGMWGALALACVALGTVVSLLAAHAVAHNDANRRAQSFHQGVTAATATLKFAVPRDEELQIGANTFFANNPGASPGEFAAWANWARMLRRYPELQSLGLVSLVHAAQLPDFAARRSGHATPLTLARPTVAGTPTTSAAGRLTLRSTPPTPSAAAVAAAAASLHITPAGSRPPYCLAAEMLARSARTSAPAGLNYCAHSPALLATRDSGQRSYAPISGASSEPVAVTTPVYRGSAPPASVQGRRAAFVGWLRAVLTPSVVLKAALQGHPQFGALLRYRAPGANAAFALGPQSAGGQTATVNLRGGWTATISDGAAGVGVLSDGEARGVLVGGVLLSGLLGLLVFLLGGGRAPRARATAAPREPRDELYDPLTGLPNRVLLLDLTERMLARVGRQSGMLAGALTIDIDWFKDVNDKLGTAAGDQLLKVVAERLETVVRTEDTVGRLEDDEFIVLVESAARGARLDRLARRILEALHKPVELDDFGPSFFLTASIGVAFGRYDTPDQMLHDARLALQAAKTAGKDRFTLFNANMRSVIEGRGMLAADLNTALQDKQLFLLYQPVFDLNTGRVAGVEALIRWQHPSHGVLPPAEFIPLAEETGLIVPMGRWVLEESCSRAAAWNVAGHRVGVSTTVSAIQLNRDGFLTDVRRALQQSGLDPSLLTLEITESTVLLDVEAATERLQEVKELGVRIAIDDFGSGYAYRSDLQRMPLDFIKVDRSSLAASDDEDYRSWLLEAILHFGRDLELTVIAKGIDTQEQMSNIRAMGCTMGQGFFMGKPVPASAVESLLATDLSAAHPAAPGEFA